MVRYKGVSHECDGRRTDIIVANAVLHLLLHSPVTVKISQTSISTPHLRRIVGETEYDGFVLATDS